MGEWCIWHEKNKGECLFFDGKICGDGYFLVIYYTWQKDEKHNYEVDFLLSSGTKLWPLEVKSSGYKSHASLDAFCKKFSSRIEKRILIYTKDYAHDEMTQLIPAYMVSVI